MASTGLGQNMVPIGDVVPGVLEQARRLWDGGGVFPGVATGYAELDGALGGLQLGAVTVAAGSDGAALKAFTIGVLLQAADSDPTSVVYCSTSSNRSYIGLRMLAARGRVSWSNVWRGRLSSGEWAHLDRADVELSAAPLWIVDHPLMTMELLEEAVESAARLANGPAVVVIDRLSGVATGREDPLPADGLGMLHEAAALNGVAVLVIEATSGASDRRLDRRPLLSDLPGADRWIDQAAAVVLVYDDAEIDPRSPDRGTVELNVAMNRFGPTGVVRVAHLVDAGVLANLELRRRHGV